MRIATSEVKAGTGRARRSASVGARVMITAVAVAVAMLTERRTAALQPGQSVVVRALAPGKLIVAQRGLPDPNFTDTVVLLIEYSAEGAAGVVLNRPSDIPIRRALPGVPPAAGIAATTYIGGPVSPRAVLALSHTACEGCRRVAPDVYLVSTPEALQTRLAAGADGRELRVYLGYAGWGRAQLESEARQGAWHVVDAEARVVFDPVPDSLWQRMIQRADAVLAALSAPFGRADG